jgi:hypothetical protein
MALVPGQGGVKAEEGHGGASGWRPWLHGRAYIQLASVVTLGREREETARRQGGGGRMGATRLARLLLLLLNECRASGRADDGNGNGSEW